MALESCGQASDCTGGEDITVAPDNGVLHEGYLDHATLFARLRLVMHHGGNGTVGGVPLRGGMVWCLGLPSGSMNPTALMSCFPPWPFLS